MTTLKHKPPGFALAPIQVASTDTDMRLPSAAKAFSSCSILDVCRTATKRFPWAETSTSFKYRDIHTVVLTLDGRETQARETAQFNVSKPRRRAEIRATFSNTPNRGLDMRELNLRMLPTVGLTYIQRSVFFLETRFPLLTLSFSELRNDVGGTLQFLFQLRDFFANWRARV